MEKAKPKDKEKADPNELGVSYPSLKEWKRRYYGDATPQRDDLAAENRALKAELARVRWFGEFGCWPAPGDGIH